MMSMAPRRLYIIYSCSSNSKNLLVALNCGLVILEVAVVIVNNMLISSPYCVSDTSWANTVPSFCQFNFRKNLKCWDFNKHRLLSLLSNERLIVKRERRADISGLVGTNMSHYVQVYTLCTCVYKCLYICTDYVHVYIMMCIIMM